MLHCATAMTQLYISDNDFIWNLFVMLLVFFAFLHRLTFFKVILKYAKFDDVLLKDDEFFSLIHVVDLLPIH